MDILEKINIILNEIKYKKVIRGGKIKRKAICPPGFKFKNGKCIRMSPAEHIKRSKSAKKSQKKVQLGAAKAKLIKKRAKLFFRLESLVGERFDLCYA